ncbi:MAG: chromate resistance protein [Deltaproteobacteria bacterium]|nr:chromate resistance protein [Deltaproteobacteria bacterium]MBI3077477.1 chromate resistance protein [Deltaproteobacteria bacterium]
MQQGPPGRPRTGARWVVLIYSLPPHPSKDRVRVWRKLQKLGALALKSSVYLLPDRADLFESFHWLAEEIQGLGGQATLMRVDRIENLTDARIVSLFRAARDEEYQEVVKGLREDLNALETLPRDRTGQALRGLEEIIKEARRRLDEIQAIDYFGARGRTEASRLLQRLRSRLTAVQASRPRQVTSSQPLSPAAFRGRLWVTRARPHIDRLASAWLIRRFIDPRATFGFTTHQRPPRQGVPFDMFGVEFGHHGEDCTFETLLKRFGLRDGRLKAIGEIVHDADLKDGKFARTEATLLDQIIRGLATTTADDQELLRLGLALFDAVYATLGERK